MKSVIIPVVALGALLTTGNAAAAPVSLKRTLVVDKSAWPHFNTASFDQDKIITAGGHQYTLYWDADKTLILVRRRLIDHRIDRLHLPYKLTINPRDGHRNTVVGVSPGDQRLHLSWDHHNNPLRYTRSIPGFLSEAPAELSKAHIEPARPLIPDDPLESRVTYPRFLGGNNGTLFFIYRQGGSGSGNTFFHQYDATTGSWTRVGTTPLFSKRGTYQAWNNSSSRNAYLNDVLFDTTGTLHITWTFREASRSWASNHDIHYAYSEDNGRTWKNNSGVDIADLTQGDPIELNDPGIVVAPVPVYSWLMNQTTMVLDGKDRPHVITFKMPRPFKPEQLEHGPPKEQAKALAMYHYWRDDQGTWHEQGPGFPLRRRPGVIFTGDDTMIIYLARNGKLAFYTATPEDRWTSWTETEITVPNLSIRKVGKPDRFLARRQHLLSFPVETITPKTGRGFVILDFEVSANR